VVDFKIAERCRIHRGSGANKFYSNVDRSPANSVGAGLDVPGNGFHGTQSDTSHVQFIVRVYRVSGIPLVVGADSSKYRYGWKGFGVRVRENEMAERGCQVNSPPHAVTIVGKSIVCIADHSKHRTWLDVIGIVSSESVVATFINWGTFVIAQMKLRQRRSLRCPVTLISSGDCLACRKE
jgi:hypothetical protein